MQGPRTNLHSRHVNHRKMETGIKLCSVTAEDTKTVVRGLMFSRSTLRLAKCGFQEGLAAEISGFSGRLSKSGEDSKIS